jgi:hypothetical protein
MSYLMFQKLISLILNPLHEVGIIYPILQVREDSAAYRGKVQGYCTE